MNLKETYSDPKLAINIQGLHKYYGHVHALRGVNLQVKHGQIFGFLGPNGAGKTTTIRCMLDQIRPQKGSIQILGINPQKKPVEVKSFTGYLPGELVLPENYRVKDALRYFSSLRRKKVKWNYINSLTRRLELDQEIQVKNLSKGNKQKLGVVQAFISQPKIMLMDEPTAGLDPLMQQEVYSMLKEAQSRGTTVFFSSHIISEVEALADRIAIIREGKIVEEINPSRLGDLSVHKVRVLFLEEFNMNDKVLPAGIRIISQNQEEVIMQVEGRMDKLIKFLAKHKVSNIETINISLEEIFLAFYNDGNREK